MGSLIVFVSPALLLMLGTFMVLSWKSNCTFGEKLADCSVLGVCIISTLLTIAFN